MPPVRRPLIGTVRVTGIPGSTTPPGSGIAATSTVAWLPSSRSTVTGVGAATAFFLALEQPLAFLALGLALQPLAGAGRVAAEAVVAGSASAHASRAAAMRRAVGRDMARLSSVAT